MENIFNIVVTVLSISGSTCLLAGMIQMYYWNKKMSAAIHQAQQELANAVVRPVQS